jgi:hypothetical protein
MQLEAENPQSEEILPNEPLRLPRLPHPQRPMKDRRQNRTEMAGEALIHALNGACARGELDAVLVTDDFGFLISTSDTHLELEELAAVTPMVARGRVGARVSRHGHERGLSVRTMRVLGETLHVAALGGRATQRERWVTQSLAATRRILA